MQLFFWRLLKRGLFCLGMGIMLTSCLAPAVPSQVPNPASRLHVELTISQSSTNATSASIHMKFFDDNNNFIEFAAGETIACNGRFLAFHDTNLLGLHVSSYIGQVPISPVGARYTCVYTIPDGAKATILVLSRRPLVFVSPTPGARVTIPKTTHQLAITYAQADGNSITGSAQDSTTQEALGQSEQDAGTYILDSPDFSTFTPGAGTLSLTREWTSTPSNTGFQAVHVAYDFTSTVQVQWV